MPENTHAHLACMCFLFREKKKVKLEMESHLVDIWSWGRLAYECNFKGCELLLVDTEGFDCQILRSVIAHCNKFPAEWPQVIQFETMGHCDKLEERGTEWKTIEALEVQGYTLLSYSNYNTVLVHTKSWKQEARLNAWLGGFSCEDCKRQWAFPYVSNGNEVLCKWCSDEREKLKQC